MARWVWGVMAALGGGIIPAVGGGVIPATSGGVMPAIDIRFNEKSKVVEFGECNQGTGITN